MGNPSEMGGQRPREEAFNFSVTCRRLSQYLREKGSFGDLVHGLTTTGGGRCRLEGTPETLTTLNLLPGVEASPAGGDGFLAADKDATADYPKVNPTPSMDLFLRRPGLGAPSDKIPDLNRVHQAAQMTIFYGGKVVVFDNFPPDKARELMAMAGGGCPAQSSPVEKRPAPPPRRPSCPPPPAPYRHSPATGSAASSETKPVSVIATPAAAAAAAATAAPSVEQEAPKKPPPAAASEMPIARRVSLNRFLEKRKDRITAKAPYPVNAPAAAPGSSWVSPAKEKGKEKEEDGKWFGLAPQVSMPRDSGGSPWPLAKAANYDDDQA